MPGPLFTVAISEAAKKGQRAVTLLIVGHSVLELILVIGFTFGLYTVFKNPIITRVIGMVGGGFLLWMGYSIITDTYRGRVSLNLSPTDKQLKLGPVFEGVTTSMSNPYWTIWWATIGAKYILDSLRHGVPGLTSFYFGHILGDFFWYGMIAYIIVTGKRFVTDRVYRGVLFVCGLFLVFLAAAFIFNIRLF